MPLKIVRNDITKMQVDAIVNTANRNPGYGDGLDTAVYHAAGEIELLQARDKIGYLEEGDAAITDGFALPAKYIIHAVSPFYLRGENNEEEKLRSCYRKSLALAKEKDCKSIAFPLIATGSYGYPKEEGMLIAMEEINAFLLKNDMLVYLVVFDDKSTKLGEKLHPDLESYIDSHYVKEKSAEEYGDEEFLWGGGSKDRRPESGSIGDDPFFNAPAIEIRKNSRDGASRRKDIPVPDFLRKEKQEDDSFGPSVGSAPDDEDANLANALFPDNEDANLPNASSPKIDTSLPEIDSTSCSDAMWDFDPFEAERKAYFSEEAASPVSLEDFWEKKDSALDLRLEHMSDTFQEYLMYLIERKQLANAQVYKSALISKQTFSKIKLNPEYHPDKSTAMRLCVGAHLNLDETRDLLARAGYALSTCDKRDIIFSYFIENGIYDMIEIDIELEERGLPCFIA